MSSTLLLQAKIIIAAVLIGALVALLAGLYLLLFSSKWKKQSVTLLTEELPTVEKRKYLAYKIFENWKCSFCERCDETFNHVWICESHASEMDNIIQETKNFLKKLVTLC